MHRCQTRMNTDLRKNQQVSPKAAAGVSLELGATTSSARAASSTRRFSDQRLAREWQTLEVMLRCYCRGHRHLEQGICLECQGLLDYAAQRLERCRFGADKPTCAKCPVHCYQRDRREQVKAVMRYAGPRMLWRHPLLSFWHWVNSRRRHGQI
jgi:hypothetical protein